MTNQIPIKKTPAEISKYMSELGKKSAAVNKRKGTAYFKWVRSHRKFEKPELEPVEEKEAE